ncbi:hypothetical protein DAMA08_002430 [Martiniozyma asiatica (nom. inval.)]|nr:hypothetical protein DAMA08_002430 [Martiniozyma asiatica]
MAQYVPNPGPFHLEEDDIIPDKSILKDFPSKTEFDESMKHFWDSVHPIISIVDRNFVEDNYQKFWDGLKAEEPVMDINFALILLAILYAVHSVMIYCEGSVGKAHIRKQKKNKLFALYTKMKTKFALEVKSTLHFLTASIIIYHTGSLYYVGMFSAFSTLSRLAEFMGLHRDSLFHHVTPNKLSVVQINQRRMIWHWIRFLDTSTSIQSGLSPHMISINASADFPSKFDFNVKTKNFDGPLNPFRLANIAEFKCGLVLESVIHFLNSDFSNADELQSKWDSTTMTLMTLYSEVGRIIKEIKSCVNNGYNAKLIRFLVANAGSGVHRVFLLHLASEKKPYFHQNKVIIMPSKINIQLTKMSKAATSTEFFNKVLTITTPYSDMTIQVMVIYLAEVKHRAALEPELANFRWVARNANPLQHCFFLIRDIYRNPHRIVDLTLLAPEIMSMPLDEGLLNYMGDKRRYALDNCLSVILELVEILPGIIRDVIHFLVELRTFVYRTIATHENDTVDESQFSAEEFDTSKFSQDLFNMMQFSPASMIPSVGNLNFEHSIPPNFQTTSEPLYNNNIEIPPQNPMMNVSENIGQLPDIKFEQNYYTMGNESQQQHYSYQ